MIKKCETCEIVMQNAWNNQRFCKPCAKERRREKFKGYKAKQRSKYGDQMNESSRKRKIILRQYRKDNNLCIDCGESKQRSILRCNACNEKLKERNIRYNRSRGMEPAGKSQYQDKALYIIRSIVNSKVKKNDRSTVYNPKTNYGLELDIYIPDLNLAFEIDGPMHRKPVYGQKRFHMQVENDKVKDGQCKAKGIKLVRISTDDIDNHGEEWLRTTLSQAVQMAK